MFSFLTQSLHCVLGCGNCFPLFFTGFTVCDAVFSAFFSCLKLGRDFVFIMFAIKNISESGEHISPRDQDPGYQALDGYDF